MNHVTRHYRSELQAHEAAVDHALRAAHSQMLADLAPNLQHLYRQIEQEQANHEDGKIPLHWLHEQGRLQQVTKAVAQRVHVFGQLTQATVGQLEQQAKDVGTRAAQAHVQHVRERK